MARHCQAISILIHTLSQNLPRTSTTLHARLAKRPTKCQAQATNKQKTIRIYTDLSSKFSIPSIGKQLYYITFIDDRTRFSCIAFLSQKSDTTRVIQNFIAQIDRQYNSTSNCRIQRFRSDDGGEYIATDLQDYFREKGIVSEVTRHAPTSQLE